MSYDSRQDTIDHICEVRARLYEVVEELRRRGRDHDESKLEPPEKEIFDAFTPKLAETTYGSDEYKAALAAMGPALAHHYAHNAHHPEHGETGIEWREIKGYEGHYEVSSFGDVRSMDRVVKRSGPTGDTRRRSQIRKANVTPKGYLRIALIRDGVQHNYMVHRLVAEAFLPNPEAKPEVNHENGCKSDNRVGNLEWATSSENQIHAYDTGLRESAVKYVVHCVELDLTTFGTQKMESELRARGYERASAAGIWSAMDRGGSHLDLTFEGTLLTDHRRDRLAGMNLIDVIEMLADWKAATLRHADGDLAASIETNVSRFSITEQTHRLLLNTARDLGWL